MPVLREVVTRYKLDTSSVEKGFATANKGINGIKSGLGGLIKGFAVAFGISGVVALNRLGTEVTRTDYALKYMAGPETYKRFKNLFSQIRADLNSVRKGAGTALNAADFNVAAEAWHKAFPEPGQLEAFGKIFRFAEAQSRLTGRNVIEIMSELQDAIESGGGFEALLNIPGFSKYRTQFLDFIAEAQRTDAPGGQVDRLNRQRLILDAITSATKEQNKALKDMPGELLTADNAAESMRKTMQELGQIVRDTLIPALKEMTEILRGVSNFLGITRGEASKAGVNPLAMFAAKAATAAIPGARTDASTRAQTAQGISRAFKALTTKEGWIGGTPEERAAALRSWGINITNHYNIQSQDPARVAEEITKKQREQLDAARASSPPTERR